MIKILDSTKTLGALAVDTTNGLGWVAPITAYVTEELNGMYELQFTASVEEKHFNLLEVGGLVKCDAGEYEGDQIFRIYEISKPINSIATVKASHITYDLNKVAVTPFTATGSVVAKNMLLSHAVNLGDFTMTTNIVNTTSTFTLDRPRYFRECLGGWDGSMLDVFRGEYEWNNLEVKMLARRGSDNGVIIAYGKNLTDFNQEENNESVYTSVIGYATYNDTAYVGNVYNKVVTTSPKIKIVDFSDQFQSEPTTARLDALAQQYALNNDIEVPKVNISVKFVPLYQTEEYKDIAPLERVGLGDTVHIYFSKLNVTASARVISRTWDVIKGRYESVQLGSAKSNLNTVIDEAVDSIEIDVDVDGAVSFLQDQLDVLGHLITNGLGLHITRVPSGSGYIYYLHNKETLANSDTQYMFTSNGFLVSTDYGQTWNAGFDSQGNAVLNSLATITLKALEIYGSAVYFGDPDDKYILAHNYTDGTDAVGVSFDGTGYARFRAQEQFLVENVADWTDETSTRVVYNSLELNKTTNGSLSRITNYDDTGAVANLMRLESATNTEANIINYYPNSTAEANRVRLRAESEATYVRLFNKQGTDNANYFNMEHTATQNNFYLYNYDLNSATAGSRLTMIATETDNTLNLLNYRIAGNNPANSIIMTTALNTSSNLESNSIELMNRAIANPANWANQIELSANTSINRITLQNRYNGTTRTANTLTMETTSTTATFELHTYTSSANVFNYISFTQSGTSSSRFEVMNQISSSQAYGLISGNSSAGAYHYAVSGSGAVTDTQMTVGNKTATIQANTITVGQSTNIANAPTIKIGAYTLSFSGGYVRYS